MLRLVLIAFCVGTSLAASLQYVDSGLDSYWKMFKKTHNKVYASDVEDKVRRMTWESNLHYIQQHNLEADMGRHSYRLGVNQYTDWTNEEFRKFLTGYSQGNATKGSATFLAPENFKEPEEVDWRKEGYVTEVKNQLHCGSCWAFSATGSLEGQHFKKTGKLVSLSEQNLVDCSMKEGNHGCGGGLMDNAFKYIEQNGGIDTEESYPYKAKNGMCEFSRANVGATCTGYVDIPRGDEDALKKAVASVGPISVAIDAGHRSFQMYKSGVYDEIFCSTTRLDHGVLAVGYGVDDGQDYWLVKNSWGETWGMSGYIMMSRNKRNQCGIATQASYPLV